MSYTIHKGRPTDTSERTQKELQTYDLLDELKIEYLRIDHRP